MTSSTPIPRGAQAPLTCALALALLTLAGGLHAQQPEDRPHPPLAGRPAPAQPAAPMEAPAMMPMMGGGPAMLLMHQQPLGLSDEQTDRLTAIAAEERRVLRERMPELMRAHADFMEATADGIDLDASRAALDRMADVHTQMVMAGLRARRDARAVLTAEQRSHVDAMMPATGMMAPMMMHHGMPGMMQGMPMMGHPMMHGAPMMREHMQRRMLPEHDRRDDHPGNPGEQRPTGR